MADNFLSQLKQTLDNCILELDEIHSMFCIHPETDFTRNRKISFQDYIRFMIQMQSKSVSNEILDFLDDVCKYYDITLRIVRIKVSDDKYICIATNLSEEEFSPADIKYLYKCRWGEETNFRELKYTSGLINWHSSKYEGILQEIYARMILYNFCELVTAHAVVKTKEDTKHVYKINFATAVNICRSYLKNGGDEIEIMRLIQRHLTPIRANHKYPTKLRPKRNRDFMYRAA